jgi:hypothetical protein
MAHPVAPYYAARIWVCTPALSDARLSSLHQPCSSAENWCGSPFAATFATSAIVSYRFDMRGLVPRLPHVRSHHLGRYAEAREAAARVLETDPAFTISAMIARGGQSNSKLLIEELRKAASVLLWCMSPELAH